MKRKFSNPVELNEFFLRELKKIVGSSYEVKAKVDLFDFDIYKEPKSQCIFGPTVLDLIKFFTKYGFEFYIDFEFGKIRAYSEERIQREKQRL